MAQKWWTLTAVVAGMFMLLLDVTVVNVALPQIQQAFGASLSDQQWITDAYALTLAALLTAGVPAGTTKRVLGMLPPPARLLYRAVWRPGYARTPRWTTATTLTSAERPIR